MFQIKYIHVDGVKDYFALPKAERERYGLYRKPMALPMGNLFGRKRKGEEEGWDAWERQIRKEYPVQWFVREWLTSYDNPAYALYARTVRKVSDAWWNIKRFVSPVHPRYQKAHPRWEYSDITELAVEINFSLILDFWHEEVVDGHVDWQSDATHKKFYKELKTHVTYIEIGRAKIQKTIDDSLTKAIDDGRELTYLQRYGKHDAAEALLEKSDTQVLVWFAKNRRFFWT